MKLLLTSSGITNKSIENAILDLLNKPFFNANLVFIPTAANVEEDISGWLEEDINNFRKLGFNTLDVIDIAEISANIWKPILENADVLVFGGGNEKYLIEKVREVGLDKLLPKYLKTKVYVGISAGSMITSKILSLNDSGRLYYEDFNREEQIEGLGYIDFEIRPHLNSEYFVQVRIDILEKIATEINHPFYAIDDNTAIKVVNDKVKVITEGQWKLFT
jgi:dipeptidase E